jgi:hypothetical protein
MVVANPASTDRDIPPYADAIPMPPTLYYAARALKLHKLSSRANNTG